jgi:hypothetical protein
MSDKVLTIEELEGAVKKSQLYYGPRGGKYLDAGLKIPAPKDGSPMSAGEHMKESHKHATLADKHDQRSGRNPYQKTVDYHQAMAQYHHGMAMHTLADDHDAHHDRTTRGLRGDINMHLKVAARNAPDRPSASVSKPEPKKEEPKVVRESIQAAELDQHIRDWNKRAADAEMSALMSGKAGGGYDESEVASMMEEWKSRGGKVDLKAELEKEKKKRDAADLSAIHAGKAGGGGKHQVRMDAIRGLMHGVSKSISLDDLETFAKACGSKHAEKGCKPKPDVLMKQDDEEGEEEEKEVDEAAEEEAKETGGPVEDEDAEKSFDEQLADLEKAAVYYGPKGGKYMDPQHKIPYKEGGEHQPGSFHDYAGHPVMVVRDGKPHQGNRTLIVRQKNGVEFVALASDLGKKMSARDAGAKGGEFKPSGSPGHAVGPPDTGHRQSLDAIGKELEAEFKGGPGNSRLSVEVTSEAWDPDKPNEVTHDISISDESWQGYSPVVSATIHPDGDFTIGTSQGKSGRSSGYSGPATKERIKSLLMALLQSEGMTKKGGKMTTKKAIEEWDELCKAMGYENPSKPKVSEKQKTEPGDPDGGPEKKKASPKGMTNEPVCTFEAPPPEDTWPSDSKEADGSAEKKESRVFKSVYEHNLETLAKSNPSAAAIVQYVGEDFYKE